MARSKTKADLVDQLPPTKLDIIHRRPRAAAFTGLSLTAFDTAVKKGDLPAPRRLTSGAAVGWLESELLAWQQSLPKVDPKDLGEADDDSAEGEPRADEEGTDKPAAA